MFAFLEGIADSIAADRVIINVSGVGYELLCSRNTLDRIGKGEVVRLYTHFQLSQDAVALYGFVTQEERAMFRQLITRVKNRSAYGSERIERAHAVRHHLRYCY